MRFHGGKGVHNMPDREFEGRLREVFRSPSNQVFE